MVGILSIGFEVEFCLFWEGKMVVWLKFLERKCGQISRRLDLFVVFKDFLVIVQGLSIGESGGGRAWSGIFQVRVVQQGCKVWGGVGYELLMVIGLEKLRALGLEGQLGFGYYVLRFGLFIFGQILLFFDRFFYVYSEDFVLGVQVFRSILKKVLGEGCFFFF